MKLSQQIIKDFRKRFVKTDNWRVTGFTVPYVKTTAQSLEDFLAEAMEKVEVETKQKIVNWCKDIISDKETLKIGDEVLGLTYADGVINVINVLENELKDIKDQREREKKKHV